MDITPALLALLDEGEQFHAEYRDGLADHRPMALVALERLGADAARLEAWARGYEQQLEPAGDIERWPSGDAWPARLGQGRAVWPAYRGLFREWLAHEGGRDVLGQALPVLLPGCGAVAFHGLIRAGYGAQTGHLAELADGLAAWAAYFMPLGALPAVAGAEPDPALLLRGLKAGTSRAGLIALRMQDAARGGAVNRAIAPLLVDAATPEKLARAAAFAYAQTGNFTALHLVTGGHAMRVLARFVVDAPAAWRHFWQAYAHGVVAARLAPLAEPAPLMAWDDLVAMALAADDEHVIKLVDSCREEERHYGGDDWRRAASRLAWRVRSGGRS